MRLASSPLVKESVVDPGILAAIIAAAATIVAALIGVLLRSRQVSRAQDEQAPRSEEARTMLPGWLRSRRRRRETIQDQIVIDLRSVNPIDISFGSDVPRITVYFRIANMSPVDLVLDRLLVNLWVGQPTLNAAILHRQEVPRRNEEIVSFAEPLSLPQQEQMQHQVRDNMLDTTVYIYVDAYFDSKIGQVHVEERFERQDVPCRLPGS